MIIAVLIIWNAVLTFILFATRRGIINGILACIEIDREGIWVSHKFDGGGSGHRIFRYPWVKK